MKLPAYETLTEVRAGEPLALGKRTAYLIVRISVLRVEGSGIAGCWTTPLAMLVTEPGNAYSVTVREALSLDDILELIPDLQETVDRALGVHRIKVT